MAKTSVVESASAPAGLDAATVKACVAEVKKEEPANGWEQGILARIVARLEALVG